MVLRIEPVVVGKEILWRESLTLQLGYALLQNFQQASDAHLIPAIRELIWVSTHLQSWIKMFGKEIL